MISHEVRKEIIRCQALDKPAYGLKSEIRNFVGRIVKFTCAPGYRLYGHETRQCKETGLWSWGEAPVCKSEFCLTEPFIFSGCSENMYPVALFPFAVDMSVSPQYGPDIRYRLDYVPRTQFSLECDSPISGSGCNFTSDRVSVTRKRARDFNRFFFDIAGNREHVLAMVGITLGILLPIGLLIFCCFLCCKPKKEKQYAHYVTREKGEE